MHSVDVYRRLEAEAEDDRSLAGLARGRLAAHRVDAERAWRSCAASTVGRRRSGSRWSSCRRGEAHERFPLMDPDGRARRRSGSRPTATSTRAASPTRSSAARAAAGWRSRPGRASPASSCATAASRSVVTDHGTIEAESVVLACGMYTPDVAALAGVNVPIVPMAHQYLITKRVDGVTDDLPQLRDPDNLVYFRREGGGLVLGGYERDPAPWSLHGVPGRLQQQAAPRGLGSLRAAHGRTRAAACPRPRRADIVSLVNGPEGFTPDNEFVLGESDVHGLFVAAGFCAHGIAGAGGVGRVMAEWIARRRAVVRHVEDGHPPLRRAVPQPRLRAAPASVEVYSTYYDIHYPNEERTAGRPLRRSPAYERLVELGCEFGEKSGWERPNWFAPNAARGDESHCGRAAGPASTGARRSAPRRSRAATASCSSTRRASRSSRSPGPGAAAFLDRVCANEMDRPVGAVTYTQLCNERAASSATSPSPGSATTRFLLVTGTAFGSHDLGWIRKQLERLRRGRRRRRARRHVGVGVLRRLGPACARRARAAHRRRPRQRRVPVPHRAADQRRRGAGASRCASPTSASSGWELYCPTEYGADAVGRALGRGRRARHASPAATARSTRCGSRRATGCGAPTSRPRTTRTRPGSASRCASTRPTPFVGQDALRAVKAAGVDAPAARDRARRPARGRARLRAGAHRRRDRRPGHERRLRLPRRRSRSPTRTSPPTAPTSAARSRSRCSASGSPGEIVRDPLYDPTGARIRA